jgi:hypothetical protein
MDALLAAATARRAVGSTGLNNDSSRSHLIIALCLEARAWGVGCRVYDIGYRV